MSVRALVVDLSREYRGGQHQALLLLTGLRDLGCTVSLMAPGESLLALRAQQAGIAVESVPNRGRRIAAARSIRRLLRQNRLDLVHANEPHALSSTWLAGAHRRVPVLAARRIALRLSSGALALARYRAASRVVAVSQFVARSLAASGLPAQRVEVIYDGVKIPAELSGADRAAARARYGIPDGAICIANAAAFVPEKGQAVLIGALEILRSAGNRCVLLLAGQGPERAALEALAGRANLTDCVRFAGFVPDIDSVYAATDLFAFPSHEEPLGSALLSAMAHGLPVVAVARGGVPEVVAGEENGLLIAQPEVPAMAGALARLLASPPDAQRLGRSARETIATRFSADQMVNATLGLYGRLCGSARLARPHRR